MFELVGYRRNLRLAGAENYTAGKVRESNFPYFFKARWLDCTVIMKTLKWLYHAQILKSVPIQNVFCYTIRKNNL